MPKDTPKEKQEKLVPVLKSKIKNSKIKPAFTENALKVIEKRYLLKDHDGRPIETPAGMFWRIARHIAKVDALYGAKSSEVAKTEEDFYEAMARLEFVPNSPTFWGAGTTLGQLSACFVLPVEDNMHSILKTQMDMGLIHKSGGGTGFSFSRLRPANSIVGTTGGAASGPIGFMQMYNDTSGIIKEGGRRRGANMGILRVDHPDILEFISYKNQEGALSNFNISVAVTDNFMKAVEENTTYDLINPQTGKKTGELKAREVFDKIVQGAWVNGEPGVIFLDKINAKNPTPPLGEIESTNPCMTGDAFVSTEKGLVQIKDLAKNCPEDGIKILTDEVVFGNLKPNTYFNGPVAVLGKTMRQLSLNKATRVFKTGKKLVYKLMTESGYEVLATVDHKFYTNLGWVALKNIVPGLHEVFLQHQEGLFNQNYQLPFDIRNKYRGKNGKEYILNLPSVWSQELGEVLGLIVGDGWLITKGKNCRLGLTFGLADEDVMVRAQKILNSFYLKKIKPIKRSDSVYHLSYHSRYFVDFFSALGLSSDKAGQKRVPASIFTAPREAVIGFLRGLFSADGTIGWRKQNNCRFIRLTSKSLDLLKDAQMLLLNLGVKSKIYDRSRASRLGFEYANTDGVKKVYQLDGQLYELHIGKESVKRFITKIGFINSKHQALSKELLKAHFYAEDFEEKIVKIEKSGIKDVYDLTEPYTQSFIANGIVISNCGEQPLLPYESCNLGSINLGLMVKEKNGEKEIDWDKLDRTVALSVHFLDNVIDANEFPIPEIEEMTKKTRKIGLGVMGLADLFFQLGIPYDSDKGLEISEKIMKRVTEKSHEVSSEIAKSRGNFPAFKSSVWDKHGVKQMRNATTTTIAPTGTISMIASASSGIEPIFALVYTKTVMDGTALVNVNEYFEQSLKKAGIHTDELIKKVAKNNGSIQNLTEIPEKMRRVYVVAGDISPEWHVKIQAAFQKYTDNAISKTINFPNSATIEDVEKSYLMAYELNCKGITVYRDGSRVEQVLTTGMKESEKKEEPTIQNQAIVATGVRIIPRERPDVIKGYTYRIKTAYGKLFVTINDDEEGQPFEIFSHLGKAGGFFAAKAEAICRLISLALRSGIDPEEIIDQIKGIRGPTPTWSEEGKMILSLPDAIAQILDKHIHREQPNLNLAFKTPDITPVSEDKIAESVQMSDGFSTVQKERSLADIGEAPACPECGGMLEFSEGCLKCPLCGYSKCS